jgi:hypothetical protein
LEEYTHKNTIYFTYYKHIIEKKNVDGETEMIEYNNWYIILHKNKLCFTIAAASVSEGVPEGVPEGVSEGVQEGVPGVPEGVQEGVQENKKREIMEYIESNKKLTIKMLKEYLVMYNLKTSGKRDELLERLIEYIKK